MDSEQSSETPMQVDETSNNDTDNVSNTTLTDQSVLNSEEGKAPKELDKETTNTNRLEEEYIGLDDIETRTGDETNTQDKECGSNYDEDELLRDDPVEVEDSVSGDADTMQGLSSGKEGGEKGTASTENSSSRKTVIIDLENSQGEQSNSPHPNEINFEEPAPLEEEEGGGGESTEKNPLDFSGSDCAEDDASKKEEGESAEGSKGGEEEKEAANRPMIMPRPFASLATSKEEAAPVQPEEPEAPNEEQAETITGDKAVPAENVLSNPEVDLYVVEVDSMGHKVVSREGLREEHAYATSTSTSELQIVNVTSNAPPPPPPLDTETNPPRKKLKVMYPRKKMSPIDAAAVPIPPKLKTCLQCCKTVHCTLKIEVGGNNYHLCSDKCLVDHKAIVSAMVHKATSRKEPPLGIPPQRLCSECGNKINMNEKTITWQTMDFCADECFAKHLNQLGSKCAQCNHDVSQIGLGKYCVRFSQMIRQFCSSVCLEEYKKGLKVCSYCLKDIVSSNDGFLAPVGDKGTFRDFCSQVCMEKYDCLCQNMLIQLSVHQCDVCDKQKLVQVEVLYNRKVYKLCSDVCFNAFKFVNSLTEGCCDMCKKYFNKPDVENWQIFWEDILHSFCSKNCMNIYILSKRKIIPCCWCKVKKYNFDMVKRTLSPANGGIIMACSLNCLALYQVSMAVTATKKIVCDKCKKLETALYHLTMSDATIRNFCSYQCVLDFQVQFKKRPIVLPANYPTPTGTPQKILPKIHHSAADSGGGPNSLPMISSVGTLATTNGQAQSTPEPTKTISTGSQVVVKNQVLVRPGMPTAKSNKMTQAHPKMSTKGVACKPLRSSKSTQTDVPEKVDPVLLPVPVPIYVPVPLAMYSVPVPTPVPFPLPIPVPVFVPTTRNSAKGIMKEIKRIQDQIPVDPFQAELLMMAEMVASDKKDTTSSDSDHDAPSPKHSSGGGGEREERSGGGEGEGVGGRSGGGEEDEEEEEEEEVNLPPVECGAGFGDVIQIALKMASELEQHHDDLANLHHHPTINTNGEREGEGGTERRRKRENSGGGGGSGVACKKLRRSPQPPPAPDLATSRPKPDANMCLKDELVTEEKTICDN